MESFKVNATEPTGSGEYTHIDHVGQFTLFDLLYLLVWIGTLIACMWYGWRLNGFLGAFIAFPVGFILGWSLRYVAALLIATAFKLFLGDKQ